LVLQDENVMFDVRIPKDKAGNGWPKVPLGSRLRVTGICSVHVDRRRVPDNFSIFPSSGASIVVLSRPSWWTLRRIVIAGALLAGLMVGVLAWVMILRRRVAAQTSVIRRRLENEALLEKRFQYVAQATNDTIWDWNLLADTVWWSEGLRTTLGYPPDEMAPDTTERWERLHPEDRDRVKNGVVAAIKGSGDHWSDEYRYRRADGAYAYVLDRGYIMRDPAGRPIRMIGAMMDISAQKQAEEALREQRTILQSVIDHVPFAVFWMDRNCRFLGCNGNMAQGAGFRSPENLIGKTLYDLPLKKELLDAFSKRDREIMESGKALLDLEENVTRANGTRAIVSTSKVPLRSAEGQVVGLVGIYADITERKRAEEELRHAKEAAETANRAKSDFLANMSHEIRTPMNGILGMTDLALDTELTADQRDYLEMVKVSADALLTVINDVLDFSKIEAGRLELDPRPFNLREHLAQSLKPLALRAHQKGLELTCEIGADVPGVVVADGARLRQVVINLIGNAIKFTKQGEVGIKVAVESKAEDEVSLHFTVHDTGIGVAPEKQRVIFEAFSQADSSMAREYGGTGLGLTISSRLVEMMNGRIWLESELGKGSCFHFTTRADIAAGSASVRPVEPVELSGMPVLVVDDNLTNRRILGDMLDRWKMKPVLAASGREAQIALQDAERSGAPFGLLLIDVNMPDMDGFKLAEQIRRQVNLSRTAIMMLTSAAQRGDAARCRELGVGAYLIKPIVQAQLLDAVRNVLGSAERNSRPHPLTRRSLPERTQRLNILLAEDNAVNQILATRLLENRGHTVTVAGNGRDALAMLEERHFDLVVMDISMPGVDGFEATAAIRARETVTGDHIPIIAMTAHAMTGDRERCLTARMDGYVSKPIRAQELFDSIESLLAVPA
jgi:two-component system, sensor histidine kinase and response regulator